MEDDIESMLWDARAVEQLNCVIRYCQSVRCRRRQLLLHFGEEPRDGWRCSGCDVCSNASLVQSQVDALYELLSWQQGWAKRLSVNPHNGGLVQSHPFVNPL